MSAQILVVFVFCDCHDVFKNFGKLKYFFFFEIPISVMGTVRVLSGSQDLRILPPIMTAPILVVFEIEVFYDFFFIFQKTWILKNPNYLKFSIL